MKFCTLASGSSGNSLFVDTGVTKLLIDAGISARQLKLRLSQIGSSLDEIDSVVITHEHSDHSNAVPRLTNPVYVSSATVGFWDGRIKRLMEFDTSVPFNIQDVLITPFSVSHDAVDPVGFTIEAGGKKIGVATDVGCVTGLVTESLKGSDALVIEFNHDDKLLSYGPYPWELKQRISSRLGHLSNTEAAGLLKSVIHDGLRHVVLAHLSRTNNAEDIAIDAAISALGRNGSEQVEISVAPRKRVGEVLTI